MAVVTNAGGVGAIAADEAAGLGLQVEPPVDGLRRELLSAFSGEAFVSNASLNNPFDLTASVTSDQFVRAVEVVAARPEYDLILALPTHHAPGMKPDVAERLGAAIRRSGKAIACCVIGNSELASIIHRELMSRSIPSYPTPERAVHALAAEHEWANSRMADWGKNRVPRRRARRFRRRAGALAPDEVSNLLRAYCIEEPGSMVIKSAEDVGRLGGLRFPLACKLLSPEATHKTELGGVLLGVRDKEEARQVLVRFQKVAARRHIAFDGMLAQEMVTKGVELLLGGTRDRTFGPTVVLGLGGTYTELLHQYRLALAPVTAEEAHRLLISEPLAKVLGGYRGGVKVSISSLCEVVSSFSRIMVDNLSIGQLELNPLVATRDRILSVDARVMLRQG